MIHAQRPFCALCSHSGHAGFQPVWKDLEKPNGDVIRVVVAVKPCRCKRPIENIRDGRMAGAEVA